MAHSYTERCTPGNAHEYRAESFYLRMWFAAGWRRFSGICSRHDQNAYAVKLGADQGAPELESDAVLWSVPLSTVHARGSISDRPLH